LAVRASIFAANGVRLPGAGLFRGVPVADTKAQHKSMKDIRFLFIVLGL